MNLLLAALVSGLCLMPPYPGDTARSGLSKTAGNFSAVPTGLGIDEPAPFDMAGHLHRERAGGPWRASSEVQGFNVLVVLVGFDAIYPDTDKRVLPIYIDSLVFGAVGRTVRDYYWDQSAGRINLTTMDPPIKWGWRVAPKAKATYVNNQYGFGPYPNNSQGLAENIIDQIDPFIDFSQYDNDGDGFVDGLILVQSGSGAELTHKTTDLWSHKWSILPRAKDGVKLRDYAVVPSWWLRLGDMTVGVYAHEIGHLFGLPDEYDLDNSSRGIGRWGLMGHGSWNGNRGDRPASLLAYDRVRLGFVTPKEVSGPPQFVNLKPGDALRVFADPQIPHRLIFASYKSQLYGSWYDGKLPHSGVLFEMVDVAKANNTQEWYPGVTPERHYKVAVVQADSLWELEKNLDSGDEGDPYPWFRGGSASNYSREWSPRWYDGKDLGIRFSEITLSGDRKSAFFKVAQCDCPHQGDIDGNGLIEAADYWALANIIFYGAPDIQDPGCPTSRGDMDNSGYVDATDLQLLVDYVVGGEGPVNPCN